MVSVIKKTFKFLIKIIIGFFIIGTFYIIFVPHKYSIRSILSKDEYKVVNYIYIFIQNKREYLIKLNPEMKIDDILARLNMLNENIAPIHSSIFEDARSFCSWRNRKNFSINSKVYRTWNTLDSGIRVIHHDIVISNDNKYIYIVSWW